MAESKTPRTAAKWKSEWETYQQHPQSSPAQGMCDLCEELELELTSEKERADFLLQALNDANAAKNGYKQSLASARQSAFGDIADIVEDWKGLSLDQFEKKYTTMSLEDAIRLASSLPPTHVRVPVAWRRRENDMWIYYETPAYDDAEPLFAAHGGGGE